MLMVYLFRDLLPTTAKVDVSYRDKSSTFRPFLQTILYTLQLMHYRLQYQLACQRPALREIFH